MGRQQSWRYLAAQRSGRVRLAIVSTGTGLLAIIVAATLTLWQTQVRDAAHSLVTWLALIGFLPVSTILGGILLIAAVILYTAPLPRTHSFLATNPRRISRVAVYLDSENQLPNAAIKPFLTHVRNFVGGRRAELVLFSDAAHTASGNKYRSLVKGGFCPVDVPHKRVPQVDGDDNNTKNAVDVELSLYAYQQALLAPHPMDIVLVAGDQDYLPLIRRLWTEGHRVHVWAMYIPTTITDLAQQLNIKTATFSSLFSWTDAGEASTSATAISQRRKRKPRSNKGSTAGKTPPGSESHAQSPGNGYTPVQTPGNTTPVDREQLVATFASHCKILDQVLKAYSNDKNIRKILGSQVGTTYRIVSESLGFTGKNWTIRWFQFLQALGLFAAGENGNNMPMMGSVDAGQAADQLLRFLQVLSENACNEAMSADDRTVSFANLRTRLASSATQESDTAALFHLIANPSPEWPFPLTQLCRAAAAVGLVRYEILVDNSTIRLSDCLSDT